MKVITTSWDDGHPLDFKLAELLDKYQVKGTFYIPKFNQEQVVMKETEIIELSKSFEIGGHTINHIRLNDQTRERYEAEITGSYEWLADILNEPPQSFCFPGGVYNNEAINCVYASGYKLARSTELLSTKAFADKSLTPTTIQIFEHKRITYFKHLVKRFRINNLIRWLSFSTSNDILKYVENFIEYVSKNEGCVHLWGHSWEIEQFDLWHKLELVLKQLSSNADFEYVANRDLLRASIK